MGKQLVTSLLLCLLIANGDTAAEGPSRFMFPAGEQALMDLLRRLPVLSSEPNAEVQNFQFTWKLRGKCEAAETIVAELATLPIAEALEQSLRARDANPPAMQVVIERQQKVCGAVFLSSQAIPWMHWNDDRMTAVSQTNAGKFVVFSNIGFTFRISEKGNADAHGFGCRTAASEIDLDLSDVLRRRLEDEYELAYSLRESAILIRKRETGSYALVKLLRTRTKGISLLNVC